MSSFDVDAIILAAGLSSRADCNKLQLDIGNETVLSRCVRPFYEICRKVIVVCGHNSTEIKKLLLGFSNIEIVENINYQDGMFSSVKTGIKHVNASKFFITPGDHPFINLEILNILLSSDGDVIIPSTENRKGHPALLNSTLIPEILLEPETSNLKNFLSKKQQNIVNISNIGILIDIDTIEDYNFALRYHRFAEGKND